MRKCLMINFKFILLYLIFNILLQYKVLCKDSINTNIIEAEHTIIKKSKVNCNSINFNLLQQCYPENNVTSGRMNKPELSFINKNNKGKYFGFYSFSDINSDNKPPLVAFALVSFEKLPWYYSDKNQELIMLIVLDKSFKCNPFLFKIEDDIKVVNEELNKLKSIDNIHYYKKENIFVAFLVKNEKILKYIVWYDENSSIEKLKLNHDIIVKYMSKK